jgi:hypothetical protein
MNRNKSLALAAAALTGLLAGSASRASAATSTLPSFDRTIPTAHSSVGARAVAMDEPTTAPADKHACKGQNSCKGNGGCKTGDNGCKGQNSCKGKGGCKTNE